MRVLAVAAIAAFVFLPTAIAGTICRDTAAGPACAGVGQASSVTYATASHEGRYAGGGAFLGAGDEDGTAQGHVRVRYASSESADASWEDLVGSPDGRATVAACPHPPIPLVFRCASRTATLP